MDFRFAPQEEAFRQEVRDFIKKELPSRWDRMVDVDTEDYYAATRVWVKKLAAKGWLAMAWPSEYGGQGRSHMEQLVYHEEIAYYRTPQDVPILMGVTWVGPSIILYGTEEQKRKYLKGITSGELGFCTLYSEPPAGSDLASLQTRAVEDGDEYVVNGQKVWTSGGHRAPYGWLAARTDPQAPKHKGISMFIVDMKSPGVTVRPLINVVGSHEFNEVFLDEVRIPKENMVGMKNQGWYIMAAALDFERSGVGGPAGNRRTLEELIGFVRENRQAYSPTQHQGIRHQLAEMVLENEAGRLLCYRVAWMQSKGLIPNYEASMAKLFNSELNQRLASFAATQILGLSGQLWAGSRGVKLEGRVMRFLLRSLGNTIEQGTSEIQRNIIAQRGLALPRGY